MSTDAKPSQTKKIALGVVGVVVLGVAFLALRPQSSASKDGEKNGAPSVTSTAGTAAGESSGDRGPSTVASAATAAGDPTAASSGAPAPSASASAVAITSGAPVDMAQLLLEAKTVEAARAALAAGDPKKALKELEFYDKIPNAQSLRQEATLLKIEALSLVGRKTDARALAYSTRDDPSFNSYQGRIEALLNSDPKH
jgi:hypothetical protein